MVAHFTTARRAFHAVAVKDLIRLKEGDVPSFADKDSRLSVDIARGITDQIEGTPPAGALPGQTSGKVFEGLVLRFLEDCFLKLGHLRPGKWSVANDHVSISTFEQYLHLTSLVEASKKTPELAAALGSDYMIIPDVVVAREPESDYSINEPAPLVDDDTVSYSSLRARAGGARILHASISCKFTIRSDRSQNSRSEALNLIRNRKGRTPHIAVVTAEPMPSRIASVALGTGDIDCVYHFALYELLKTVEGLGDRAEDAAELLKIMVDGKRLRDLSDLPMDLAV